MKKRVSLSPGGDQAFRAESLYGKDIDAVYSGATSFLRRKYTRNLQGVDLAVSGIPYDFSTTGRPGARFGPRAIRIASSTLSELDAYPQSFDPFAQFAVADYGDCLILPEDANNIGSIIDIISTHVNTIIADGTACMLLGGDHFITYPSLIAHAKKYNDIALIHFDAHPDTWDDSTGLNHGTMFSRAVKEKLIDPEASIQIGIRTLVENTLGIKIVNAEEVWSMGIEAVVDLIKHRVGNRPCYLTFDIDCLDPAFAPGTGTPVAGGLSSREALGIIRRLSGVSIIGMDIVEVAPSYDHAEATALVAAHIAYDLVCLLANKSSA